MKSTPPPTAPPPLLLRSSTAYLFFRKTRHIYDAITKASKAIRQ